MEQTKALSVLVPIRLRKAESLHVDRKSRRRLANRVDLNDKRPMDEFEAETIVERELRDARNLDKAGEKRVKRTRDHRRIRKSREFFRGFHRGWTSSASSFNSQNIFRLQPKI